MCDIIILVWFVRMYLSDAKLKLDFRGAMKVQEAEVYGLCDVVRSAFLLLSLLHNILNLNLSCDWHDRPELRALSYL